MARQSQQRSNETEPVPLKDQVRNLIEEARMVLPGIQAIFGFQLIAVFNQSFGEFGQPWQYLHLFAMLMVALAVLLIMTPAAYHRIAEPDQVSRRLSTLASRLIAGAMIPFAIGIALEVLLITYMIGDSLTAAVSTALACGLAFILAWFVFPLSARRRRLMRGEMRASRS